MDKRLFDIVLSMLVLLIFSPLMALTSILVKFKLGSPILFKQLRPGLNGKPFMIYKFRTMNNAQDFNGNTLPDDQRLGKLGKFLRSTSIDELPELINVLKGDTSLVGPRPLLMEYLDRYSVEQGRRHKVKPGITGLAQINGRNAITWEEKFRYDISYVDNHSFILDLKILFKTVTKVLRREGVNATGEATMTEFKGSDKP